MSARASDHVGEVLALGDELDYFAVAGANRPRHQSASFRICNLRTTYLGCCLVAGTSWHEIDPDFFQPSRSSQVLGWYTTSGSYVAGPRHRNASSPYSAQPGNIAALENQSTVQLDIGARWSSWWRRQLLRQYANAWRA